MSDDVRDEPLPVSSDSAESSSAVDGPLRSCRVRPTRRAAVARDRRRRRGAGLAGRRARASGGAPAAAKPAAPAARAGAAPALVFLDKHAFDTLAILGEQIVPGSRAAKVPEFLDRLLAVESTDTQKRFTQAHRRLRAPGARRARQAVEVADGGRGHRAPHEDVRGAGQRGHAPRLRVDQGRRGRDLLRDRGRPEGARLESQRDVRVADRLRLAVWMLACRSA